MIEKLIADLEKALEFDTPSLCALHLLKSRYRLDVAGAYNRGVEVGRKEGREK